MLHLIRRYTRWLHTQWPAGHVEKLPMVREDGSTNVPGLFVVGDLTGVPLLKFSVDTGARAVQIIADESSFQQRNQAAEVLDLVIIGGGVSGMSAALEARQQGLSFKVLEATEPFSTIVNFPKGKPIYTYPTEMKPAGQLHVEAEVKEPLVDELREQTDQVEVTIARAERVERQGDLLKVHLAEGEDLQAHRVIVGIGRSGNFRRLGVPGEDKDKVYNRLHDPKDYCDQDVLVVGGGDSALETAIALAGCGANVTVSYRKTEFSRPKPENVEKLRDLQDNPDADIGVGEPSSERVTTASGTWQGEGRQPGTITLALGTKVKEIGDDAVELVDQDGEETSLRNDAVFSMIGREPPLDFFRRSGVAIHGEWRARDYTSFGLFLAFCVLIYNWKAWGGLTIWFRDRGWFPFNVGTWMDGLGGALAQWSQTPGHLLHVLRNAISEPSFYYTLAYCSAVVVFGIIRIRKRRTPYITWQTTVLALIQVIPLFLLPYILLPWMGENGLFDGGLGKWIGDQFFPDGSYWRAFGLILAWPLFVYNIFTEQPLWGWIVLGFIQTFVIIPLIIRRWGKGAYCGWICSCGALAETLGDAHRQKMPHGPFWNRLNMVGQVILWVAFLMLGLRIAGWLIPGNDVISRAFSVMLEKGSLFGVQVNYKWIVDITLAGIIGVGFYFWFSGRVWCRFACPLAALMHIYTRFSRFRIIPEKKKCISCNVCTSVCHQGIDVMNFANKGEPMNDPECVRCSACVYSCPTGVLSFGEVDRQTGEVLRRDQLGASPVRMREKEREG